MAGRNGHCPPRPPPHPHHSLPPRRPQTRKRRLAGAMARSPSRRASGGRPPTYSPPPSSRNECRVRLSRPGPRQSHRRPARSQPPAESTPRRVVRALPALVACHRVAPRGPAPEHTPSGLVYTRRPHRCRPRNPRIRSLLPRIAATKYGFFATRAERGNNVPTRSGPGIPLLSPAQLGLG